jgi:hypothetical protein
MLIVLTQKRLRLYAAFFVFVCSLAFFVWFEEILAFLYNAFGYLYAGLRLLAEGNNNSANYRLDQIFMVIDLNEWLILGAGVSKSLYMFESLYSLYLYRYGLLGLMAFLFLCCLMVFCSFRLAKLTEFSEYKIHFLAVGFWFLVYPINALSSSHHDTPKFAIIFYGLAGVVCKLYLTRVNMAKSQKMLSRDKL